MGSPASFGARRRALLVAPGRDVDALADVLRNPEIGSFEVTTLADEPTDALKLAIEDFFAGARRDDLLLLYLACDLVVSEDRRLYLATRTTDPNALRATAIEDGFVNDFMEHSRARSIVLVLDCDDSGVRHLIDVEGRFEGRGRIVLSTSTALAYGIEGSAADVPEPLLTDSLVEGLATGDADVDHDGVISIDDLYEYVHRSMRERSTDQTPVMAGEIGHEIALARGRRAPELPAELHRAMSSQLAGVRAGAVGELAALLQSAEPGTATMARGALERLAEDDSRTVAAAARDALGGQVPAPPGAPGPVPGRAGAWPRPRWPRIRLRKPRLAMRRRDVDHPLARARAKAAVEPTGAAGDADRVDCTVFAPERVGPSQNVFVQVFAHTLEQAAQARRLAVQFDRAAETRAVRSLASPIPHGSQLTFELRMREAAIEDPVQTLVWRGRPESVQFAVRVGAATGACVGTLVVRRDMWPVGHVKFKLDVEHDAGASPPVPVGAHARRYRRAFLSYASEDRPKVIDRVQILRLLQVEYFQDLLALEPGERWERRLYEEIERSDLFILFWSRPARDSEWVRKETRHALAHRGGDELGAPEICPVIVEGPPVAPPWEELAHLHFNDALLFLKAGHPS